MARRFRARPSVGEATPAGDRLAAWMGRAEVQAQRSAIQADPDWPVRQKVGRGVDGQAPRLGAQLGCRSRLVKATAFCGLVTRFIRLSPG